MTYITFVHPSTHSSISTHIPTYLPTDLPTYTTSVVEGSWEAKFRETDDLEWKLGEWCRSKVASEGSGSSGTRRLGERAT